MALFKRKDTTAWWMDYTDAEGKRVRESTRTDNKQLARELHDKRLAEVWEQKRLGIKRDRKFDEAVALFLEEKRKKGIAAISDYEDHCDWWLSKFRGRSLRSITQELIVETIKEREAINSPATCNRYLSTLRGMLRLVTIKYKWLRRDEMPNFFFYEEPKGRVRWLTPDEIARLLDALPPHWKDIAQFSFATGQRQANVLNLRWEQIDLQNRTVVFDWKEMKGRRSHGIPLNDAAVEVLSRRIGTHHTYVFTYQGHPIKSCSWDMWQRALRRAGIEDFRPHDMRHTWASMLAQRGVPDGVLQKLGAWQTPKMVDRYRHHDTASLAPYAAKADEVLAATSQLLTRSPRNNLKVVN
jgi:integrase